MLSLGYIIPAHNAELSLVSTIATLRERLVSIADSEIIIVENGSTDRTLEIALSLVDPTSSPVIAVIETSKGLGNALREGVCRSTATTVVCTAADLPFGFSDLNAFLRLDKPPAVVIGSKAHPQSFVTRPPLRRLMSWVLRLCRRLILDSRVRDTQGTFLMDGNIGRRLFAASVETGFLVTTEVAVLAEREGILIQEVPVELRRQDNPSTVHPIRDGLDMLRGLFRIRRRLKRL